MIIMTLHAEALVLIFIMMTNEAYLSSPAL